MQYDLHSEYPVILRQTEEGVVGTWYENRFKPQMEILDELEALGHVVEVAMIKEYATTLRSKLSAFEHKMEVQRRIQRLAASAKPYNPFEVVELVGEAYFEPLASSQWHVSGVTFIEWHEEAEDSDRDHRYQLELEGVFLKSLSQWDYSDGQWKSLSMLEISFNCSMRDKFAGAELVATPCK